MTFLTVARPSSAMRIWILPSSVLVLSCIMAAAYPGLKRKAWDTASPAPKSGLSTVVTKGGSNDDPKRQRMGMSTQCQSRHSKPRFLGSAWKAILTFRYQAYCCDDRTRSHTGQRPQDSGTRIAAADQGGFTRLVLIMSPLTCLRERVQ